MPPVERPITFSGPMVRAILDGRKTQTRRLIKLRELGRSEIALGNEILRVKNCRFRVGQRRWVRETWAEYGPGAVLYQATNIGYPVERWRDAMFMPRWASRLTLEITEVRVQRLQGISEADAKAEGVSSPWSDLQWQGGKALIDRRNPAFDPDKAIGGYRGSFGMLWDTLYPKEHTWSDDPWVWAITFRVIA